MADLQQIILQHLDKNDVIKDTSVALPSANFKSVQGML